MTIKQHLVDLEFARNKVVEDAQKLQKALSPFYNYLYKSSDSSYRNLDEVGISEMVKISKSVIDFCKEMKKP